MPKLTCHCGCIEAEISVPINELAKVQQWVWLKTKILKSLREKIN
jgi:hypothetical protein